MTSLTPYITFYVNEYTVYREDIHVGIGAQVVSYLKLKNLKNYTSCFGHYVPTVVHIKHIISSDRVIVRDCSGKEYEVSVSELEPALFNENGYQFYADMQEKALKIVRTF